MHVSVLLYVLSLLSRSHGSDQLDFKQWSSVYLPDAAQKELDAIYPTWKKNAELVSAHNQQNSQFTMTLNKFAHLVTKISVNYSSTVLKPSSLSVDCWSSAQNPFTIFFSKGARSKNSFGKCHSPRFIRLARTQCNHSSTWSGTDRLQ